MATIKLTSTKFKEEILNYEIEQDWNYKGQLPAIIDFYADWCGPCKMIAPVLEALSEEFKDQLLVYKVDTEAEQELAAVFGIQSIPSLLFIPTEGMPMMQAGALSKMALKQIITEKLLMKEKVEEVK
jgi:thioredoxin